MSEFMAMVKEMRVGQTRYFTATRRGNKTEALEALKQVVILHTNVDKAIKEAQGEATQVSLL